jgi:hypothetical protein
MLTGIYPGDGVSYTDLTAAKSTVRGPTTSDLPPRIAQHDPAVLGSTGVIVVSRDCAKGLVVAVNASEKVGTISVAHDSTHGDITALVLADLADSPTWVTIYAYQDRTLVAQARVQL